MRTFTWKGESLSQGIELIQDERLGKVIFLGEQGRGRRYEKIGLSRRNPAVVIGNRVLEAKVTKITLPPKDGKPEKSFFVLEDTTVKSESILIRINTYGGYQRPSFGREGLGSCKVIAGSPKEVIAGHGAFGDAGRVGSWDDVLMVMGKGDVFKIRPSFIDTPSDDLMLWVDKNGNPKTAKVSDYHMLMAVEKAESKITSLEEKMPLLVGQSKCFSFEGGRITSGFKLEKGVAGTSILLGERGRGREMEEVHAFDAEPNTLLTNASVADLGRGVVGLVQSDGPETNDCLVRICTKLGNTRRGSGTWKT